MKDRLSLARTSTRIVRTVVLVLFAVLLFPSLVPGQSDRKPWVTSRILGSPEPPLPYTVQRILPEIEFKNPVDFAVEPGTARWFILQLDGKLFALDPANSDGPQLVHDAHETIDEHRRSFGIEFHPDYQNNREVFLSYVKQDNTADGTHVSRFRVESGKTPKIDPVSEEVIITWYSGGHNGACMKFGPDRKLYITAGDGTGPFPPDSANVGQDLSDLRSTIMRIDVDQEGIDRPYTIPVDNPFVDFPNARPEVWSFGFRNPWKISFDQQTGELWCGDVGWELWELVFRVERGGNYGWSIKEGSQSVRSDVQQGPGEIQPPIVEHLHTEARSVTGGYVYYGSELPNLKGTYIYGDYVTGKIWGLQNDGNRVEHHEELADTSLAIITFGVDADGELIVIDYAGGLYRLVPNPQSDTSKQFPRLLSKTGLFEELSPEMVNASGVYDYVLNTTMWQDGAESHYQIALPETSSIEWKANHEHWKYPANTVLVKTIQRDVTIDSFAVPQKVETQILHFDGLEWHPYSYLWNDSQTDAELVAADGTTKILGIPNPSAKMGGEEVEYRVHSRAECASCHVPRAGHAIGFDLPNLDRKQQIEKMVQLGLFSQQIPEKQRKQKMVAVDHDGILNVKARSYLAINCAHCHRRGGGGTAHIEFPFTHDLKKTNSVSAAPTQGTFEIPGAEIIAPSDPYRSVLYYRMSTIGRGHMPHLGNQQIDSEGLALVREWIESLDSGVKASSHRSQRVAIDKLMALSTDEQEIPEEIQSQVTSTVPAMRLATAIEDIGNPLKQAEVARRLVPHSPTHIRGLFERFLPLNERIPTLGSEVDSQAILALAGDSKRGQQLFAVESGMTCRNCHRVGEIGKEVGPDLSKIGSQRNRVEILQSILEPSRKIDQKFALHTVETTTGKIHSGVISQENDESITLKDAAGKEISIARDQIEQMITQPRSLMPDLLVKEMTAQELADLLAYLESLK